MKLSMMFKNLLLALITSFAVTISASAEIPSQEELAIANQWTSAHLGSREAALPFSFNFDGKPSTQLLNQWEFKSEQRKLDAARTESLMTWRDPSTQLSIRCVVVAYSDFPAMEWTLYIKNEGSAPTPLLSDILALDTQFDSKPNGNFVLNGNQGDSCTADSFQPFSKSFSPGTTEWFAPNGGRPTNGSFPYYNLRSPDGGILFAIGWPGQWVSTFSCEKENELHVTAGQELFSASLNPGEEIRSPLIAMVFWQGTDLVRAQNLWRRWMVAHNLPRTSDGKLPPTQIVACSSHQFTEMTKANEENQKHFVDRYLEEGMKLDYWWMDAGWYPCKGVWTNTGTWEPDPERFPNGLRAVSDHARANGVKTIVWFEPERVGDPQSWLAKNHPEWLLPKQADKPGVLFNLGNPEARNWLINHVDHLLTEQGIDLYRQDFNIDPLAYWRGADAPGRQGMTENFYVQGYLAYWDALKKRHPNLRIDSCASGGRRDDLETMRRAVPLIRSDYLFEPIGQQDHHYAFASWIPYHGAGYVTGTSAIGARGSSNVNVYDFRSNMSPSLTLCYDMRQTDLNYELARQLFKQLKTIQPYYLGDFYPLTPYSLANNAWLAWQYDRPEDGSGVVQVFRRPENDETTKTLTLFALDPDAKYECTDFDHGKKIYSGRELLENGLIVHLSQSPSSAVILYKKIEK